MVWNQTSIRGAGGKTPNVGRLIPLLEDSNLLRGKTPFGRLNTPNVGAKWKLFFVSCNVPTFFPMVFPNMKKRLPQKHLRHWAPKQLD